MKNLSCRMSDSEHENLEMLALNDGVTPSAYIRDIIRSRARFEPLRRAVKQWLARELAALDETDDGAEADDQETRQ